MTDLIRVDTTQVLHDFRDAPLEYQVRVLTPAEQAENAAAVAAARASGAVPTLHSVPMEPFTMRAAIQGACGARLAGDEALGGAVFDLWTIGMEAKNALAGFTVEQVARMEQRIGTSWPPEMAGAAIAVLREAKGAYDKAVLDKAATAGKTAQ